MFACSHFYFHLSPCLFLMTRCLFCLCALFFALPVFSQTREAQQAALSYLYSGEIDTDAEFQQALSRAKAAGVPEQARLEAEIIFFLNRGELPQVKKALAAMDSVQTKWVYSQAQYLDKPNRWNAVKNYFEAVVALSDEDFKKFEVSIKESFWLDPELGPLLARVVQKYHSTVGMRGVVIPMDLALTAAGGKKVTLAELVKGNKAVLLDFWASWCGPCKQLLPDLIKKQKLLAPQGIIVAGVNVESLNVGLREAKRFREDYGIDFPWLIEPDDSSLSRMLNVEAIPRMILLSPEGNVLYNDHPSRNELKLALKKLGVTLDAPGR